MHGELILKDKSKFSGISFGAEKSISGEVVFNTGMAGYVETLTDPSYGGQILVLTYPLIGNYGVPEKKEKDNILLNFESNMIQVKGLIVSDYSHKYSHWAAVKSLSDWLKEENIPALYNIDTRALTKKLRTKGVMLGKIRINSDVQIEDPNKRNLVAEVSIKEPVVYEKGHTKLMLIDTGVKNNIIRCFLERGITVIRVPWDYDIFNGKFEYDGLFLSNGPGDPKMCDVTINNVRKAMKQKIPLFGICLGNQILALAAGADTYKLKYGHRSQNQPCLEIGTKKCHITSQNHGYAVDEKTLPKSFEPWFRNSNDGTNEGIRHKNGLFKSAQFHLEHSPGPKDTEFMFDEFIKLLRR